MNCRFKDYAKKNLRSRPVNKCEAPVMKSLVVQSVSEDETKFIVVHESTVDSSQGQRQQQLNLKLAAVTND